MPSRKSLIRAFYFKAADDSYVFPAPKPRKQATFLSSYTFSKPNLFLSPRRFDKDALPIPFRELPETLLDLSIKAVQKWPLPSVFTWTIEDICLWLRRLGYPQYQNTFRENLVNGRTLLLLDASALSAINIQDFDHIRHITYNIRYLFYFEMSTFARSISLPPENYFDLYKLLRVQNGAKYEITTQPSDLWRNMQLIQPPLALADHWEKLERWLQFESASKFKNVIAYKKRYPLYECRKKFQKPEPEATENKPCACMPPCECHWTEREVRSPWTLDIISFNKKDVEPCHFKARVLTVLRESFPERYRSIYIRRPSGTKI